MNLEEARQECRRLRSELPRNGLVPTIYRARYKDGSQTNRYSIRFEKTDAPTAFFPDGDYTQHFHEQPERLTVPTIHNNGTSADELIETLCTASNALNDAYNALKQTAPNGRDFYPQGNDALRRATEEHTSRLNRLDEIKQEIDELTQAIDAAKNS